MVFTVHTLVAEENAMDAEKAFVTLTVLNILNKAQAFLPFSIHSVVQVRQGERGGLGASCRGESAIRGGGGGTGVRKGMDQSSRQGGKGQRLLQNVSANILKIQSHQSSNFKCMDSFWFPFTQKQFCLIYLLYRLYSCCASLGVMKMRWQLPG